jgi:E3 ubiquitin-protein ligase BRE1
MKLEAESHAAISDKELQLTKAEMDLVRIRNARDELASDLNMKKAVEEQERVASTKMKELNAAHEQRIAALESEAERLRLQLDQGESSVSNREELSDGELRSKYHVLEQSSSMLENEVVSMSSSLKKYTVLASSKVAEIAGYEEKLLRMAAEKSKATEKYFAVMKLKESRDQEVRSLKLQNTKTSDVVSQLKEAEAEARNLVVNYEKQLVETKEALTSMTAQHRASVHQIAESNNNTERFKSQVSKLEKLMIEKDGSLASMSNSLRQAEIEVQKLQVGLRDAQKAVELAKVRNMATASVDPDQFRVSLENLSLEIAHADGVSSNWFSVVSAQTV